VVVVDGEADAEAVVGQGQQLDGVLHQADGLRDLEVADGRSLGDDAGLLDVAHVVVAAAAVGLGRFVGIDVDDAVVHAEAVEGGQDVLDGVDADAVAGEGGVAQGHVDMWRVLDPGGELHGRRLVDAAEANARIGGRRMEAHGDRVARVQADALVGELPGQSLLLPDHGCASPPSAAPRRRASSSSSSRSRWAISGRRATRACRRMA
jgi:hypothetical protein